MSSVHIIFKDIQMSQNLLAQSTEPFLLSRIYCLCWNVIKISEFLLKPCFRIFRSTYGRVRWRVDYKQPKEIRVNSCIRNCYFPVRYWATMVGNSFLIQRIKNYKLIIAMLTSFLQGFAKWMGPITAHDNWRVGQCPFERSNTIGREYLHKLD